MPKHEESFLKEKKGETWNFAMGCICNMITADEDEVRETVNKLDSKTCKCSSCAGKIKYSYALKEDPIKFGATIFELFKKNPYVNEIEYLDISGSKETQVWVHIPYKKVFISLERPLYIKFRVPRSELTVLGLSKGTGTEDFYVIYDGFRYIMASKEDEIIFHKVQELMLDILHEKFDSISYHKSPLALDPSIFKNNATSVPASKLKDVLLAVYRRFKLRMARYYTHSCLLEQYDTISNCIDTKLVESLYLLMEHINIGLNFLERGKIKAEVKKNVNELRGAYLELSLIEHEMNGRKDVELPAFMKIRENVCRKDESTIEYLNSEIDKEDIIHSTLFSAIIPAVISALVTLAVLYLTGKPSC